MFTQQMNRFFLLFLSCKRKLSLVRFKRLSSFLKSMLEKEEERQGQRERRKETKKTARDRDMEAKIQRQQEIERWKQRATR